MSPPMSTAWPKCALAEALPVSRVVYVVDTPEAEPWNT
jgi:hypothetical protein